MRKRSGMLDGNPAGLYNTSCAMQQDRKVTFFASHTAHREPGCRTSHTAKAPLPSGVDSLNTALAQAFCAESC